MKIVIALIVVFAISFLLLLKFIYSDNKKEAEAEKTTIFYVILTAFVLALAPTAVIALILFALLGSTVSVNMLFALHISTKQLILLAISLLVYLFSIDSIIEVIVKHIVGKNILYFIIVLLIRLLVFYAIGLAFGLEQTSSFTIATGVAIIILLFEILYLASERGKEEDLYE